MGTPTEYEGLLTAWRAAGDAEGLTVR
jgi:hypothetical protein